jgi:hypothetical protein
MQIDATQILQSLLKKTGRSWREDRNQGGVSKKTS